MKRQSVEDYVKERFEMEKSESNYVFIKNKEVAKKWRLNLHTRYPVVKTYDDGDVEIFHPGIAPGVLIILDSGDYSYSDPYEDEESKDEYVYVTNEFLLKKYDLEKHRMYKVVFHDEIYKDLIGIEIPTCPKEFTLYLCHGQYSYSDPNGHENKPDLVNHPSHYETGKFECIDVMEEALGRDVVKGFCIGNAFKYLYRAKRKNGLEDLKKAQWYLNKVISMEDADNTKDPYEDQKKRLKKIEENMLNEAYKSERFI